MEGAVYRKVKNSEEPQPPMRLLTVSKEGAYFHRLVEGGGASPGEQSAATHLELEKSFPSYPSATLGQFAPHGGRIAVIADPTGLHIVDCKEGRELRLILKATPISALAISPCDNLLITCEKFVQGEKNLIVWDIASGKEVAQFEWKKGSKEGTKSIKFSEDERYCARISSKTSVEVFATDNFTTPMVTIQATSEVLAKKGQGKGQKFWFDGFEFVPSHTTPTGQAHQFLFVW